MTTTKKLLMVSAVCLVLVALLIVFVGPFIPHPNDLLNAILVGLFSALILTGALIPFGMWIYHLSQWIDETKQSSVLYSDSPIVNKTKDQDK